MDEKTVSGIVAAAVQTERAAQKALADAREDARLYVGNIIGCDSAEQVYVKALSSYGVKASAIKGAPVGVLREMLHMQTPRSQRAVTPRVAQDAKTAKGFFDRFPEAARIGHSV